MKTKIFSLLIVAIAIVVSTSVFAQPTATGVATSDSYANVGNTLSYTVSAGGVTTGFTWALRASGGNSGSAPSFSASTSNSQSVDWSGTTGGDIFYLDVYYVDGVGCYSEMLTFQITITDAEFCLAATGNTVTETCSLIETNTSGNSGSATGGDASELNLTITGGLPNSTYSAVYSVDGNNQTAVSISTDASGDGSTLITVNFTSFAASFTNDSGSNSTVTIAAVQATDANSTIVSATAGCVSDVTVHTTPTISF